MLNAVHLQTLDAVLATGSLSAAARRLGYTTSAVSQHVAALERSLGVALFERGPRSLWPTAAGIAMGRHARSVLSELSAAEQDMQSYAAGGSGRLRVGAFPSVSARVVPTALARLVEQVPDAEVGLEQGTPARVVSDLRSCRIDLGLVYEYDHVAAEWPDDLIGHQILSEELVLLCVADDANRSPILTDLAELAGASWASNKPDNPGHANFLGLCTRAGFTPRIRFHSNDYEALRGIVRCGLAVAMVPALALGTDRTIGMRRLPEPPRRYVVALSRSNDPNTLIGPAVAALTAAAREFVAWSAEAVYNRLGTDLAVVPDRATAPAVTPSAPGPGTGG